MVIKVAIRIGVIIRINIVPASCEHTSFLFILHCRVIIIMTQRASPKIIGESERRRSFCTTTRYADSRMTHKNVIVSDHGEKKDDNMKKEEFKFNYQETVAKLAKYYNSGTFFSILKYISIGFYPPVWISHSSSIDQDAVIWVTAYH